MRDQLAELVAVLQNPHEERNFKAYQRSHRDYHQVQGQTKTLSVGERKEEHRGREAAYQPDHQLDRDEARHEAAAEESGEEAADSHREQIRANDGGELEDAVAEQVACESAGDQLINEPAGGDQEDGEKKYDGQARVLKIMSGLSGRRRLSAAAPRGSAAAARNGCPTRQHSCNREIS